MEPAVHVVSRYYEYKQKLMRGPYAYYNLKQFPYAKMYYIWQQITDFSINLTRWLSQPGIHM